MSSLLAFAAQTFKLPITKKTLFNERKEVVREFFASHQAMVILDNWETVEGKDAKELWDFVLKS